MQIKDLISNCTLGVGMYVNNDTIKSFISYLIYNKDIIEQFPELVLAINTDEEDTSYIQEMLNLYVEDANFLFLDKNRGHSFGHIDLDEALITVCQNLSPKYLFKISQDILLDENFLSTEIEEADFYFVPGFSYETTQKVTSHDELFNLIQKCNSEYFTPQTNSFILNKEIKHVYGNPEFVKEHYVKYQEALKHNPNIKPWEIFSDPKFACEELLGRNVTQHNYKTHNLLSKKDFVNLWNNVKNYKIGDPSHKNIMLPCGICHYHFLNQPIMKLI
jgi:hypothetical protein